jgi:chemotaxis signal transduction protein
VFTVGGVTFAFDARHARYVLRAGETPCGAVVPFLGRPYPVIDLRQVFGHPNPPRTGFVLLVESDATAGLHIDDLCGLRALDPRGLAPLPAVYRGPERRWVAGLATADDTVIVVARMRELLETLLPADRAAEVG